MNILIVDDEPDFYKAIKLSLANTSHKFFSSRSAEEAKLVIAEKRDGIDIVITDVLMPGQDGLSMIEEIKELRRIPEIIVASGHADLQMCLRAMRLGAVDFILKPYTHEDLLAAIDRAKAAIEQTQTQYHSLSNFITKREICLETRTDLQSVNPMCMYIDREFLGSENVVTKRSVRLALKEALNNALIHGNLGISSSFKTGSDWRPFYDAIDERLEMPYYSDRRVSVKAAIDGSVLIISVEDQGEGFNHAGSGLSSEITAMREHGRGILLIKHYMDSIAWNERGNKIVMSKQLSCNTD